MAQLVARLHGMQKVRGSNPLSSTVFFGSSFEGKAPNQEPRRLGQALSSFSSPKTLSRAVALLPIAVGHVRGQAAVWSGCRPDALAAAAHARSSSPTTRA